MVFQEALCVLRSTQVRLTHRCTLNAGHTCLVEVVHASPPPQDKADALQDHSGLGAFTRASVNHPVSPCPSFQVSARAGDQGVVPVTFSQVLTGMALGYNLLIDRLRVDVGHSCKIKIVSPT